MSVDDTLSTVGELGLYQKRVVALLCLVGLASVFLEQGSQFWAATPSHHCDVRTILHNQGIHANISDSALYNLTIPWETGPDGVKHRSKCSTYSYLYTTPPSADPVNLSRWAQAQRSKSKDTMECAQWIYNRDKMSSTVVTKVSTHGPFQIKFIILTHRTVLCM